MRGANGYDVQTCLAASCARQPHEVRRPRSHRKAASSA